MRQKNKIAIYGCGGMGINACTKVINIPTNATGFADVEFTLVDTSQSNLSSSAEGMNKYLIPGLDGSGKDRKFTHEQALPHINTILTKHQPKDFNIVIFSLAGGSGSVLGPLLISELLSRDENVFAFCVGNLDSGIEADNSLKTVATLQGISQSKQCPVVARFYMNDVDYTRTHVDTQLEHDIRALALFLSGTNEELDNEDIHKFLFFNRVSKVPVPPQLVDFMVFSQTDTAELPSGFVAIAVASVLPSYDDARLNLGQPYSCAGYMPAGLTEASSSGFKPLHFILTNAFLNERLEKLNAVVAKFEESKKILAQTPSLKLTEGMSDGGFFL